LKKLGWDIKVDFMDGLGELVSDVIWFDWYVF
jgi:hypothetical protein